MRPSVNDAEVTFVRVRHAVSTFSYRFMRCQSAALMHFRVSGASTCISSPVALRFTVRRLSVLSLVGSGLPRAFTRRLFCCRRRLVTLVARPRTLTATTPTCTSSAPARGLRRVPSWRRSVRRTTNLIVALCARGSSDVSAKRTQYCGFWHHLGFCFILSSVTVSGCAPSSSGSVGGGVKGMPALFAGLDSSSTTSTGPPQLSCSGVRSQAPGRYTLLVSVTLAMSSAERQKTRRQKRPSRFFWPACGTMTYFVSGSSVTSWQTTSPRASLLAIRSWAESAITSLSSQIRPSTPSASLSILSRWKPMLGPTRLAAPARRPCRCCRET
mmetsp:Transcript_23301/g.72921  ORF Transcript_23301/g.72921 Transcript_23301/m.72921 type:complete len:327 (-) Transcript_23301:1534-2514(-)